MPKVKKIRVEYEKCNRDGECLEVCTQLVWTWKRKGMKKVPYHKHPERCIICEKCKDVCPEDSIEMELEV
jgi:NAD-dependent dihydropyrimidine dehydrogenase PreA subunit